LLEVIDECGELAGLTAALKVWSNLVKDFKDRSGYLE